MRANGFNCESVVWGNVRDEVKKINPELTEIIDKISPDKRYPLVKATYKFGDLIVTDGVLQIPTSTQLLSLHDQSVNNEIKNLLSYAKIPLSLILTRASEVFVCENERIIPLNIFYPGKLFGVFETLCAMFQMECLPIWNVSAGARNILMLPKITDLTGLKRLKSIYGLSNSLQVKTLADHWHLFKAMANSHAFEQIWGQEIIFFTTNWFENKNDPAWHEFREYVFKQSWKQSQYAIAKFEFGIFWQQVIKAITSRNLKPNTYLTDTVKHLLAVILGASPGVVAADDSNLIAPTYEIKKAIIDVYQLKQYFPTIMHSGMLDVNHIKSVYYSLNFPTLLEGTPKARKEMTIMFDLKEIKLIFETIQRILVSSNNLLENVILEYFHVDKDHEIKPSILLFEKDKNFLNEESIYPKRVFCGTSQFWRGCIKITKN